MRRITFLLAALSAILCPTFLQAQGPAIDKLARRTMEQWKLPGLALVVVHKNKLVYLKGFGVRELGKPEPVTPDTVFPIASCTKSFTTLAMGMLADEDKLGWDDPGR